MAAKDTSSAARRYLENYDKIQFTTAGPTSLSGRYVARNGDLVPIEQAGPLQPRNVQAVNHASEALGVHPKQIGELDRLYDAAGVHCQHRPDGIPVFDTRRDFLKAIKARGFFHKNDGL